MNQRRARVAIVQRVLSPYNVPLFERLARSDRFAARVFVTAPAGGRPPEFPFVTAFEKPRLLWRFEERTGIVVPAARLLRELRAWRPDCVLMDGLSSLGTSLAILARRVGRTPQCFWWSLGAIPGRVSTVRSRLGDAVQRYCVRRCEGVIAYSTNAAAYFRALDVPAARITVGHNTLDESRIQQDAIRCAPTVAALRRRLNLADAPVAIFSGTMRPGKRTDLLLAAFARCRRKLPGKDPRLVLIGDGPELPSLRALATALGVAEAAHFVGRQEAEASAFFLLGQFVVLPGLGGLAINHAFAHGLPVICGPADGCELDLVETGVTGVYVPSMNEETLSAAMADLYGRPDECRRMGAAALEFVTGKFSLENYARRIEEAVDAGAGENHGPR